MMMMLMMMMMSLEQYVEGNFSEWLQVVLLYPSVRLQ